jgi:Lar family restriction alleviation protein
MSEELGPTRELTKEEVAAIYAVENSLLSCPFCGHDATIERIPLNKRGYNPGSYKEYFVSCEACSASIAGCPKLSEAIAAWNRRA